MKLTTTATTATLLLFLLLLLTAATAAPSNYNHYLLNCGAASSSATSTYDSRIWLSDNNSTFSATFSSTISATTTTASPPIPFSTARIFTSNFTYSFPVSPGPKFIRLFFNPATYSTTNASFSGNTSFLTVQTNSGHLLLRNFSAHLQNASTSTLEFYLHVTGSLLRLTFSPTPPSSFAFINGIELVSVPENLYVTGSKLKNLASSSTTGVEFDLETSTALETAHRINAGGKELNPNEDSGGMYRRWLNDEPYLSPTFEGMTGFDDSQAAISYKTANFSAPVEVYRTFRSMGNKEVGNSVRKRVNVTWDFEVELGFLYLVRLHWCEVVVDINASSYRVFDVYINGVTAEKGADVFQWAGGHTAVYKDYVVYMATAGEGGDMSQGVLQLAMHPNDESSPRYLDTLLNGLEIFKINRSNGSLDGLNPSPATTPNNQSSSPPPKSPSNHLLLTVIGATVGAILLAVAAILYYLLLRKQPKVSTKPSTTTSDKSNKSLKSNKPVEPNATLPSDLCRRFSLAEIKAATSNFNGSLIIGHGGFGNVYKGTIAGEAGHPVAVAIKRLNPHSRQGANEFTTEIEMLSKLRHRHLVALVGFSDESKEMILVYEYMPRGTLRDHIFPSESNLNPPLSWRRRLQICLESARGLHYLHASAGHVIIHRDVKTTNILLDDRWTAKVSDFGLSKVGPTEGDDTTHVSTVVKGSFGYVDPEYYRRQQLTEKSDVYSFGVVLFEVLCGRAAVDPTLPKEQINLAVWARKSQQGGALEAIVDAGVKSEIAPACLRKFGEVAESCVRDAGVERPSMADVVWGLEFALELQVEADGGAPAPETKSGSGEVTVDVGEDYSYASGLTLSTMDMNLGVSESRLKMNLSNSSELQSGTSDGSEIFSQIFNPEER